MTRDEYVAHRMSAVLYEGWDPAQVHALACLACEAVDEWQRAKWRHAVETISVRRDHTVQEAAAYRDGVEDSIEHWEKYWGDV